MLVVSFSSFLDYVSADPVVPLQTDDGKDPINLVWYGYGREILVWQFLVDRGWTDSFCLSNKYVNGIVQTSQLVYPPDTCICGGFECRVHVRIWNMGSDPIWGEWSIGAVHMEHCCSGLDHIVDSWEDAETKVRNDFKSRLNCEVESVGDYPLSNDRDYQGHPNDGKAAFIKMKNPNSCKGGSPYIHTWNGTGFSLDNNLLPSSAKNYTGTDIADWYGLQRLLAKDKRSDYRVMLRELEHDHSFLDKFDLFAVDHGTDVKVAVSRTGTFLTYRTPLPPMSAIDNSGLDVTEVLSSQGGSFYESKPRSYVDMIFGGLDVSAGAKLILRADPPCPCKTSILVQVRDSANSWKTVSAIIPRVHWSIDIVDLRSYLPDSFGEIRVRLYFTATHRVDFAGLDTSPQETITVQTHPLMIAYSTSYGEMTAKLSTSDNIYGELLPGQEIFLIFDSTRQTMPARDFAVFVEGYYLPII